MSQLNCLFWLDVANCKQVKYWHIFQVLSVAQQITDINVCDTCLFTLKQIKKIERTFRHLKLFKFCAYITMTDTVEWNRRLGPQYTGPLSLCEAIVEILAELN